MESTTELEEAGESHTSFWVQGWERPLSSRTLTEECKGGGVLPEGDNEEYKGSGLPGTMGCWKNTGVGVPQ